MLRFYGLRITERDEAEKGREMLRGWGYGVKLWWERGGGEGRWAM